MIWLLFIGTMALSLWATWRVKSVYNRYNQGVVRSGVTGGQVVSAPNAPRLVIAADGAAPVSVVVTAAAG